MFHQVWGQVVLPGWYNFSYTPVMKTAISIPDPLFEAAEETAKRLRMSRSELYTRALREFLDEQQTAHITERLNQVYEDISLTVDPVLVGLQAASLPTEEW